VEPQEALHTILDQGLEMEALANRLTALARTDTPMPRGPLVQTNLEGLAQHAVAAVQPAALQGGITLTLESNGPVRALGAAADIGDALISVLENAVRFSPPDRSVTVRVLSSGRWAIVEVTDEGPGMDPTELPRVTDPFFQGRAGQARGGTGLGLAIANALLTGLGGRLQISSRPGAGTTVRLLLPYSR